MNGIVTRAEIRSSLSQEELNELSTSEVNMHIDNVYVQYIQFELSKQYEGLRLTCTKIEIIYLLILYYKAKL